LDVHRKRTQVAVLDGEGQELLNRNVVNGSVEMLMLLKDLAPGTPVAFESGLGMSWVIDLLEQHRLELHLAHPSRCKAIAAARLKNDRVDARTLAHLLRTDLLPEGWIAPPAVRELRTLVRQRMHLVRRRTSAKVRVQAILADHGASGANLWTRPGRTRLASIPLPETARWIVQDSCTLVDTIDPLIQRVELRLRSRLSGDPRVEALMKIPSVGWVTAWTLVAEIGDVSRFASARRLCSWAGLTPTVHASDKTIRHGHISKLGPSSLRWVLVEAAKTARNTEEFSDAWKRIARRRGRNIATVAIARKLLVRAYYVLKDFTD
jgi:transposase